MFVRLQSSAPGGVPERPKGTGCKPVGSAYGGSNPPAPMFGFQRTAAGSLLRAQAIAACAAWSARGSAQRKRLNLMDAEMLGMRVKERPDRGDLMPDRQLRREGWKHLHHIQP